MWIFDSYFKGCVELWSRERGLERISAAYPQSFYMHLKDPHAHWEMIEGLASRSGSKSAASIASSALSRATGSAPAAKSPRRSRFRHATLPSFTTWMSGRINGIWPRKTSSPAEIETSPDFLPTLRSLKHHGNGGSWRSKLS